jgi:hypothetical protein
MNDGTGNIVLAAPKIGEGLHILTVRESEHARLHELFADLLEMGLDVLDVENDLDDSEREILRQHGALVTAASAPQKPLFACALDEIESQEFTGNVDSLRINPTFRFDPFDLSNFRTLMSEKNFSPYLPTAWIKSPDTELDLGYWISHAHASVFAELRAGGDLPAGIAPDLVDKLISAGIAIEPSAHAIKEKNATSEIEEAKDRFSRDKYAVLSQVIPAAQLRAIQSFYRSYIGQGFMAFGDSLVKRRFREPNEPLARFFHLSLTGLMSKLAGCEVKPTYCYAASYRGGADLRPHIDREMCEYSFSVQVDYEPEPVDGLSPWALNLSTRKLNEDNKYSLEWSDFESSQATEKAIYLRNGDCLAYRGCELAHYRRPLPEGHTSTSLFFHYVPMDYTGDLM